MYIFESRSTVIHLLANEMGSERLLRMCGTCLWYHFGNGTDLEVGESMSGCEFSGQRREELETGRVCGLEKGGYYGVRGKGVTGDHWFLR